MNVFSCLFDVALQTLEQNLKGGEVLLGRARGSLGRVKGVDISGVGREGEHRRRKEKIPGENRKEKVRKEEKDRTCVEKREKAKREYNTRIQSEDRRRGQR